jgi:enoyl-CoA hydratase/carnithine racemase
MDYDDLIYEKEGAIATITLNRPEALNAISLGMLSSLSKALRDADADEAIRVIVMTGADAVCAGLDLKVMFRSRHKRRFGVRFDLPNSPPMSCGRQTSRLSARSTALPRAAGSTSRSAATCASLPDKARMGAIFHASGILPESGGAWMLPRLLGWAKAAELVFRGG